MLGGEAPGVRVEVELLAEVGHGQVDVPQVGDQALGHGVLSRGPEGVTRSAGQAGWLVSMAMERIRLGMSPWTWSSCHWASWLEASTTVFARSNRRAWKASHRSWSSVSALGQQLREDDGVLQGHRTALGDGGRAGVRGVADEHHPAAVPRRVEEVGLEPGVVDPGRGRSASRGSRPTGRGRPATAASSWPAAPRARARCGPGRPRRCRRRASPRRSGSSRRCRTGRRSRGRCGSRSPGAGRTRARCPCRRTWSPG